MGTGQHVDAVDLHRAQPLNHSKNVPATRRLGPGAADSLGRQRDSPGHEFRNPFHDLIKPCRGQGSNRQWLTMALWAIPSGLNGRLHPREANLWPPFLLAVRPPLLS